MIVMIGVPRIGLSDRRLELVLVRFSRRNINPLRTPDQLLSPPLHGN